MKQDQKPKPPVAATPRAILYIMLAVLAWGGVLALGVYLYGGAHQGFKAGLVVGCVIAFLGLWALLLTRRKPTSADGSHVLPPIHPPRATSSSSPRD